MAANRLLCTDLDRTLLPNGLLPESPGARELFARVVKQFEFKLAYVTGRHRQLVKQAIDEYMIPIPDYVISDVGTKIYDVVDSEWHLDQDWESDISKDWQGKDQLQLRDSLLDIKGIELQEPEKQSTHKLSYYVSLSTNKDIVLYEMYRRLEKMNVNASLIWSVDELSKIGLLDVLPKNATKLHAIDFLCQRLDIGRSEAIFAGDSGNDLPVMISPIPSVLVANASEEVKAEARREAERAGNGKALYFALGRYLGMNGNYSAGIVEGMCHFWPMIRQSLELDEMAVQKKAGLFLACGR